MGVASANAMAGCADDVALIDLGQQFRPSHEHGSTLAQPECLELEIAEKGQGRGLPRPYAFRLAAPIASVERNIGWALTQPGHGPL